MPVPALVELAEVLEDLGIEADARADPLRDLAVASEDGDADLDRLGEALLHGLLQLVGGQVGEDAGEGADEDSPELGVAAEVGDREVLAERDLVAEGRGEQVGVGVAADVAQDRLVIDLAPLGRVEAQRRGEPHGEHAGAKRKIPRLASGEVGGIGEHHHEVGTSNRDVSHAHAPPSSGRAWRSKFRLGKLPLRRPRKFARA